MSGLPERFCEIFSLAMLADSHCEKLGNPKGRCCLNRVLCAMNAMNIHRFIASPFSVFPS